MTKLMSYDDICRVTGMSKSFVKQANYRGELGPPIRLGHRRPRWTEQQIEAWIERAKGNEKTRDDERAIYSEKTRARERPYGATNKEVT